MKKLILYKPDDDMRAIITKMMDESIVTVEAIDEKEIRRLIEECGSDYESVIVPYDGHILHKKFLKEECQIENVQTVYEYRAANEESGIRHDYAVFHKNLVDVSGANYYLGKRVLIIGGTSGIGIACAKAFLLAGADVVIAGRNRSRMDQALSDLREFGDRVYAETWDISDIEHNPQKLMEAEKTVGAPVEVVVNSAGATTTSSFFDIKEDEYDCIMDTNLKGMFFFSQTLARYWINKKVKGSLVNILSIGGYKAAVNPYGVSKWGGVGLTRGLGHMLAEYGITVNGVAPGEVATEFIGHKEGDTLARRYSKTGRITLPDEVASVVLLLASFMGKQMPGEVIKMAGGDDTIKLF